MSASRTGGPASLWLPLQDLRGAWGGVAVLLLCYAATMARDLSFYDSAELALVAVQAGRSHPIGQPLHTLLGALLSRSGLPVLPALNLLSAIPAALSLLPLCSLAEGRGGMPPRRGAALILGTLMLYGLHLAPWESASRVEVYALAGLLSLWVLARAEAQADAGWLATGVGLGLCGAANGYLAALTALALLPRLLQLLRSASGRGQLLRLGLGGLLGLLPYLQIPLSAGRVQDGAFVWGTPGDLWFYLRGGDYAHNRGLTAAEYGAHWLRWLRWAAASGVAPLWALGAAGWVVSRKGSGGASGLAPLLLLPLTVALLCSHVVFAPDILDYIDYLAPGLLAAGAGTAALLGRAPARGLRLRLLALGAVALLCLAQQPVLRSRAGDRTARRLAEAALAEAPPSAILVLEADHWAWPLLYLQEAEGRRPDVSLVAYGLADSGWYWSHLFQRHRDLRRIPLPDRHRAARIRRLLLANPERPVLFESAPLAAEIGFTPCAVGLLVHAAPACAAAGAPDALVRQLLAEVGGASPATDAVLARVAERRGEALWRLGRGEEAMAALLSGVPAPLRPGALPLGPRQVTPLAQELGPWRDAPALGDARRNLFLAGQLLLQSGAAAEATQALVAAAELGLPEAQELISRLGEIGKR